NAFSYTATAGDGTYSFYTLATDKAGNVEPIPTSADESVRVQTTVLDTAAPSVTLAAVSSPTNASKTPFSGTAGHQAADASHSADDATVTVKVYSGSTVSGSALRTLTASVNSTTGAWSISSADWDTQLKAALADGTYTAEATQSDGAANTGTSTDQTFKVDTV